jgi:general secretion pathway protein D
MVFLRPVVVRDAAETEQLSLDRYDLMRSSQQSVQPSFNLVLPINDSAVLPPPAQRGVKPSSTPASIAPTALPTAKE